MICEKCGTALPDDAVFCGECGGIVNFKGKNICESCLKEIK